MARYATIILTTLTLFFFSNLLGQSNKFYKIEIENWGLLSTGRTNWSISKDSVYFSRQNIDGTLETFTKKLSRTENDSIINYLIKINLSNINKNNIDNSAPDDMGEYDFKIIIDKTKKEFHVYQIKIDDVFNLVKQINKYLPNKYHIGYDDTYFRFKK